MEIGNNNNVSNLKAVFSTSKGKKKFMHIPAVKSLSRDLGVLLHNHQPKRDLPFSADIIIRKGDQTVRFLCD